MTGRRVVEVAEFPRLLEGARVVSVESVFDPSGMDDGYLVVRFDNGATLYSDAPTVYEGEGVAS